MTDDRRYRALRLLREGRAYHEIGADLGCSTAEAYELVKAARDASPREEAEDQRRLAAERLDAEIARCQAIQDTLQERVGQGDLDAIDRTLKATETKVHIEARRAKLLGLDAPTKAEVTGKDGAPLIDENAHATLLARLVSLASREAPAEGEGSGAAEADAG